MTARQRKARIRDICLQLTLLSKDGWRLAKPADYEPLERELTRLRGYPADIAPPRCVPCIRWANKGYRCSARTHGECDCPKCQGYCKCRSAS